MTEGNGKREYAAPGSDLWNERVKALFDKIRTDIARVGWSAIGILGAIPFTYTIGLTETYDHPELIVYGMGQKQGHSVLACAIERIKNEDLEFHPGERYSGVLKNYEVEFREHPTRPLNAAAEYYGVEELPVLQLVWPDAEGNFPGEEGMNPDFELVQKPQND